jgi:hypothetical protein
MTPEPPYVIEMIEVKRYNPRYGDDRVCDCGHQYRRHFDTYEDMRPVGCKYCDCYTFSEEKQRRILELEWLIPKEDDRGRRDALRAELEQLQAEIAKDLDQ